MKSMTLFYEVKNGLYVNLTNRCNCSCSFCIRKAADCVYGQTESLWLEHEPTFAELQAAADRIDFAKYQEIVFCGYGEPTCALENLLRLADFIKTKTHLPVRLNTNGLGSLYNKQDITSLLKGGVDVVSISLNAPTKERYNEITRPSDEEHSFSQMLQFASECAKTFRKVILTTVSGTISKDEEAECKKICDKLGVFYRIREYAR